MTRKYEFSWSLLGDLREGRPNLGPMVGTEIYRLMQFCFRDILEQNYGTAAADKIFYEAGLLAGRQFYENAVQKTGDFGDFIKTLQALLAEKGIGILRMENADIAQGKFTLSIWEDLDCSGMPELDHEICVYDEGFLAGLLESHTGEQFDVKEVACWCTGDRTCRFVAQVVKTPPA